MEGNNKYIIISPVYNEEVNVVRTINSVLKQTIFPLKWIIVNDGSTDNTLSIVEKYKANFSFIEIVNKRKSLVEFGTHAVVNFYAGFEHINELDWDFIVKLDGDLEIDRNDFFELQINRMLNNEKLGICSGITYSYINGEKVLTKGRPSWRTGGAMKFYRKQCFEEIGGLVPIYGWDGIDEYKAMYRGWETRTFFDLHVNHLGKTRALSREKQSWLNEAKGKSFHQRGYPLFFILMKGFKIILFNSRFSGFYFIRGYFKAKREKIPQVVTPEEKKFIRNFQIKRIFRLF